MTKDTFSSLLMTFSRWCGWLLGRIWYIYPGLWRMLIVSWLYCTPLPCIWWGVMRLWYANWSSLAFEPMSPMLWIIPWSIIEFHSNKCSLTIPQILSTHDGNMLCALSRRRHYSTGTNSRVTINNITQYGWRRATGGWDITTCRLGSTQAIMVRLRTVHLKSHRWASNLMIYP